MLIMIMYVNITALQRIENVLVFQVETTVGRRSKLRKSWDIRLKIVAYFDISKDRSSEIR